MPTQTIEAASQTTACHASFGVREAVEAILSKAHSYEWSLQGMGMLRLHLPNNIRLHIWDSRFRVPGVSMIHDHLQWGLESTVIAGRLTNRRYVIAPDDFVGASNAYTFTVLKPGQGCYHKTEPRAVRLAALTPEIYWPGQRYSQRPDEIHETDAADGTVTMMRKTPTDDESARVFWLQGTTWGSAEPRAATPEEVQQITSNALAKWF